MKTVTIVATDLTDTHPMASEIEVYVDGTQVAQGTIGGPPEDALRSRQYAWVEEAIGAVARACGARVVVRSRSMVEAEFDALDAHRTRR